MSVRRGRDRFVFGPGEACAWDATETHSGVPHRSDSWEARLLVVEPPAFEDHLRDLELVPTGFTFADPRLSDPTLVAELAAAHRASEDASAPRLAKESLLADYLTSLLATSGIAPTASQTESSERARRDPALRRACDYLRAHLARNVTLAELAAAARVPRFRVLRLFRARFGAPPHRYLLAQRVALARRLLEAGRPPSDVAAATGFADQAHLHRLFARTLGITPGEYARGFRR
jgi:AraC-like DNA-binding protein